MSLKVVHSGSLMTVTGCIALCLLLSLSWSASAQGTRQSVDGVIIQQEGEGVVSQMEWDPSDETLLIAWGPDAFLLDRDFNILQQVSDDQWPWSVSWNPTGTEFLVTTRTGYQIWSWDGQVAALARETLVANEIVSAYWSNLGTKIATIERLPGEFFAITVQVVIRSAVTGEVLQTSADYFGIPTENAIADQWDWSPTDDRYLYGVGYTVEIRADGLPYVSRDPMVYRIDTETGLSERITWLGSSLFYSIGLDPAGNYLVATDNSVTQIWSLIEDERITYFPGPTIGVSWRRDGQFLMAGAGAINITTMERIGGFEFGPSIVRINSRYNIVASAHDTALLLQDLTAFDAYTPMLLVTETPSFTLTSTPTLTPTPTFSATPTPTATFTFTHIPTSTFTSTFTPTNTPTPTSTLTPTPTFTPTFTPTPAFTCTTTAANPSALVNAITAANADGNSADTICLTANSTYSFFSASNSIALPSITTPITIIGNGAILEHSSGAPQFRAFNVTASGSLTLQNMTVRNFNAGGGNGGAVQNAGSLTLDGVTLTGNSARFAGGIHSSGTLTVANSTFTSNSSQENAGAIYLNSGTLTMSDTTLESNSARYGSGIYMNDGTATLTNVTARANSANEQGAGVYQRTGTLTITGGVFESNTARFGNGVYVDAGMATLNGVVIQNNTATEEGAAIYNRTGTLSVSGSTFDNNRARYGAAIANRGLMTLSGSIFTGNIAVESGGAVYHQNANTQNAIAQSCFSGNTARFGGAVFSQTASYNAQNNWWGAASGPTSALVNVNVLTSPYLTTCPN